MWMTAAVAFVSLLPVAGQTRSAEPQLRALFDSMGRIRNARMMIVSQSRESAEEGMYPGNMADLWYEGPGKFRIEYSSYWGDSAVYVSDGRTMLVEPLADYAPAVLKDAKKTIYDSDPELALRGGRVFPVFYMLAGRSGFDKLVDKKKPIVSVPGRNGLEAIQFDSPELGKTTVLYTPGKNPVVQAIEYDDIPSRKRFHQLYPEWVDAPGKDPLIQVEIHYVSLGSKLDPNLFATVVPKGRSVQDTRKRRKP